MLALQDKHAAGIAGHAFQRVVQPVKFVALQILPALQLLRHVRAVVLEQEVVEIA